MAYSIRLPDGTLVENIPDEVTPEAAKAKILQARPELGKTERSMGQALGDIGASAVSGLGSLAQLPGQAYGLATGDFDTGILQGAKKFKKFGEELKSEGLRAREAQRDIKVAEAENSGQLSAFGTSFAETIKDPALFTSFLAEQVPQLFVPGSAAMGAGRMAFAKAVAGGATEKAATAAAVAAGTAAAKGAGAIQQGADVGAQAYEDIYARLLKDGKSKEEAAAQTLGLARATGASAAAISWLAQGLPGAQAVEKALAGGATKTGIAKAFAAGAAGEGASEMVEEGGGKFSQNLAMRDVDPTQALMQGVGATMGQAAVGGVGMGGAAGAISSRRGQPEATTPPTGTPTPSDLEKANDERIRRKAQEQLSAAQGKDARAGEKLLAAEDADLAAQAAADSKARGEALAAQEAELRAKREADLQAAFPADYQDVMDGANSYAELFKEKQSLEGERKTKEVRERIAQIDARMLEITEADTRVATAVARLQKDQEKLAKAAGFPAKKSAKAMEAAPAQVEMREALGVPEQPQTDLFGNPLEAAPDEAAPTVGDIAEGVPLTTENLETLGLGPSRAEMRKAGQMNLFGRQPKQAATPTQADTGLEEAVTAEEQPVTEPKKVEKPAALTPETAPTVVSPDVLGALGVGRTATIRKADHGIMGKDIADPAQAGEVKSILEAYREGRSPAIQQKIDAYLARPEFQAAAPTAPATTGETNVGPAKQKGRGTRVPAPVKADTGSTAPTVAESERAGMVPAGQDANADIEREGKPAAPVEPAPAPGTTRIVNKNFKATTKPAAPATKAAKPKGMFDQLVAAEKPKEEGAAPEQLQSLPDDIEKEIPVHLRTWGGVKLWAPESQGAEATTGVQAALQEKAKAGDVRGALQAILDAPAGVYNELDKLVAKRLLAAGSLPTLEVVGKIESGADGMYDAVNDHVTLAEGSVGSHTLLHELVHGFVHRIIGLHEGGISKNLHVGNLRQLYDFVAKQRPDLIQTYGMTNLSEFASEVMSNKAFQKELQKISYRRENAFTAFAKSVLRILGISPTDENTALGAALISVEAVMGDGRRLQESAKGTKVEGSLDGVAEVWGQSTLDAIRQIQDAVGSDTPAQVGGVMEQALSGIKRAREKTGILAAFRQAAVNKYATVESKVSQMFSQGVRDAFGNLNPMLLVRQADDSAKVIMDFFRAGGIRINKDGLVETFDTDLSATKALKEIQAFAEAEGMDFEKAKKDISTVLEGHRLHSIREFNNELEQSAKILEAQGKNKEADRERARKIRLHMTNQEIDTLEEIYQSTPGVQKVQEAFNATRGQAIDLMVASGRITKERGDDWKANSAYVPFDRVLEDIGPNPMPRGKGLAVLGSDPAIKGSLERPIKNTIDSYMNTLGWMVEDAMKNRAAVELLETMAGVGYAEKHAKPSQAKNQNLVVPRLFQNGEPVYFEVQNEFDMAAFQQAPEMTNWLIKGLAATSRFMRTSVTAMPPFAVKQVLEDATRAALYSGVNRPMVVAMKTLYNLPRTFYGEFTGKKSPMVKRMEELGIIGDFDFNIYQPTTEIEKEIGAKKRGTAGTIFHRLEQFTKASDLAARLAVYEETMRDTNGDEVLAQTRARELINFNRRGSSGTMNTLSRVIPFFNAYAQGMDVLYRAASGIDSTSSIERGAARRLFWSRVGMMTAFGMMYALAMSGDDGYENATEDVRDNNWILPGGYKLPVPKELGFIFKTIPERAIEYVKRSGTPEEQSVGEAVTGVLKSALSTYGMPNTVPSTIRPVLENMANYSFFLQRELESTSMKGKEPGQRYTSSTSELAKAIGGALNMEALTPIKIDNLIRGWFGLVGSTTLLATDAMLNPTRPDRPIYQMPFASIFLYDTIGGRAKNEFYDFQNKAAQAENTFNDIMKTDPEKAVQYLEKNEALISVAPMLNASLEELSNLRRLRLMVEQGSDEMVGMTGEERRKFIDEVRQAENDTLGYVRELKKQVNDMR